MLQSGEATVKPTGERKRETEAGARAAARGEPGRSRETQLLEREGELRRILTAIASARAGSGAVVALEGSAGIGKTWLLRAAMPPAAERDVGGGRGPRGG